MPFCGIQYPHSVGSAPNVRPAVECECFTSSAPQMQHPEQGCDKKDANNCEAGGFYKNSVYETTTAGSASTSCPTPKGCFKVSLFNTLFYLRTNTNPRGASRTTGG